ncbi:hypothetical protein N7490_003970 [Penicillium lividum]|nr:hypothetical protein N7490_003970 [Penicillium lividum]
MQLLLKNGAAVDAQDSFKQTALSRAAWRGRHKCVSLLLGQDAKSDIPDRNKQLPLHLAAANGTPQVVKFLCEKQSLTAVDSDQKTCLHLAAKSGHREAAQILIEKMVWNNFIGNGAFRTLEKVDGWQNDFADTCRKSDVSAWAAFNGIESMIIRLIQGGANVEFPSSVCAMNAMQAAAIASNIEILKLLLERKANVNARPAGVNGRTALQAAAGAGHTTIVELLLGNKADVNAKPAANNGRTALQAAADAGHIKIVELLNTANTHAFYNNILAQSKDSCIIIASIPLDFEASALYIARLGRRNTYLFHWELHLATTTTDGIVFHITNKADQTTWEYGRAPTNEMPNLQHLNCRVWLKEALIAMDDEVYFNLRKGLADFEEEAKTLGMVCKSKSERKVLRSKVCMS